MERFAAVARAIDRLNDWVGRAVSWGVLAMVLITFSVAVGRYLFDWGDVRLQESYVWLHGCVFMLGSGYALLHDGHVRVDVLYRPASATTKAWIDLIGSVLLTIPVMLLIWLSSSGYVLESWSKLEGSREAGGLPGLFLLKSVILAFALLTGLQALSLAAKSWLRLRGRDDLLGEPPGLEA